MIFIIKGFLRNLGKTNAYNRCDTIWVVRQADKLGGGLETQTKDLNSRSPTRPEVEEERKVREKTEGELTTDPRDSSRQRTGEVTSRREIAVQGKGGQQKEAVRKDSQRWVGIPSSL